MPGDVLTSPKPVKSDDWLLDVASQESVFNGYTPTNYRFVECRFYIPWCLHEETAGPAPEHALFEACEFDQGVGLKGHGSELLHSGSGFFRNCFIAGELSLTGVKTEIPVFLNDHVHKQTLDRITIEGCELMGRFTLADTGHIAKVDLPSTVFHKKFAFINVSVGC